MFTFHSNVIVSFCTVVVVVVVVTIGCCNYFVIVHQSASTSSSSSSSSSSVTTSTIIDNNDVHTTTTATTCQNDIEWIQHPILCNVLQRLTVPVEQPTSSSSSSSLLQTLYENVEVDEKIISSSSSSSSTMMISTHDLFQFSAAMGYIIDLRHNNNNNNDIIITDEKSSSPIIIKKTDQSSSSSPVVTSTNAVIHTTTALSRRNLGQQQQQQSTTATTTTNNNNNNNHPIPVVIAHGMGDSCYNDGMVHFTQYISSLLNNVYTVCIPIGMNQVEDTKNGYFLNMNDSIDYFAQQVQNDIQLMSSEVFYAIGLSQGNAIIRGYIAKYNSILPSVHTFISINGVNAGIGAVPHCIPEDILQRNQKHHHQQQQQQLTSSFSSSSFLPPPLSSYVVNTLCDLLMEQASAAAYTTFAQQHSFQANYWRDPRPSEYDTYRTYSQLAQLNNEVLNPLNFNETIRHNWSYTSKFVWIMALDDRTVWPPLGEQWGAPDPTNPYKHILHMNETVWYINDTFGLRTAQIQNKNYFESFPGDHLQFTKEDLQRWIKTYLV